MPMLERTAASLEPCSLHKVLPSVPRSARSRRQLHTAFWQHGAASFELLDACQAILGSNMDESPSNTRSAMPAPSVKAPELLTASAFLLDFLYPRGTLSFLRKLNCNPLDRYEKPAFRVATPLSRFQVAAVSNTAYLDAPAQGEAGAHLAPPQKLDNDNGESHDRTRPGAGVEDTEGAAPEAFEDIFARKLGVKSLDDLPSERKRKKKERFAGPTTDGEFGAFEDAFANKFTEKAARSTHVEESWPLEDQENTEHPEEKRWRSFDEIFEGQVLTPEETTDPEKLEKAMTSGSSAFPDYVWHLYEHLEPSVRDQYTRPVLNYLANAASVPEPRAFCDMVSRLDASTWTHSLVRTSIKTALLLDDMPAAAEFFGRALDTMAWSQEFDLVLAHGLDNREWDMTLSLWDRCRQRLLSDDVPKVDFYATTRIKDLAARLSEFWEHIRSMGSNRSKYERLKQSYNGVLQYILATSMKQLPVDVAVQMVKQLRDAASYEELIKFCVGRHDRMLASELYQSYRTLPGVKIRIQVLREMLTIYYPHNDHGMELVLKDWYDRYERLDYIAYQKFICFYALRGDVASVIRLWKEFREVYKSRAVWNPRARRALIDVYAVRGDVAKARAVFDEINSGGGRAPDVQQYNMLLYAHRKAWDLEGALETFKELCENTTPNNYSFGYLMVLTGSRGDLKLTISLYRIARNAGIKADVAMLDAMVQAYCESDRLEAAEDLCNVATRKRLLPAEVKFSGRVTTPYTIIWNTVLRYHAMRHDLTSLNRILEHMAKVKIPYDSKTYEYLLLGLVLCKQANHALQLVEIAEEKGTFTPSADHYSLLMSGFLNTREPSAVMKISRLMADRHMPDSAEKMTKLMEAFGQWAQLPRGRRLGLPAQRYLGAALLAFHKSLGREERTSKDDTRSVASQYSKMIDILVQMSEFATIPEIMSLYESQFPDRSAPQAMPLKLLQSLMRANFYEKKYDRVMEIWDIMFDRVVSLRDHEPLPSVPTWEQDHGKISPAHRYLLSEALATVFKVHDTTGDIDNLIAIVTRLRNAGFALSGENWNRYIQMLARSGRWLDAFSLCEEVLMPQWPGWARRRAKARQTIRLPLDMRRLGRAYRYARPNTHTLMMLIRQFMELERMAPWSTAHAAMVEKITDECPRFVRAAKTMMPSGSDLELSILGEDLTKGVDDEILRYVMKDDESVFAEDDDGMVFET